MAQNRAAWLALKCARRANINNMHVNLSWLKVEERLTSLPVFVRSVDMLIAPWCLFKLLAHSLDMTPQVSSQSPSPEQTMGGAQYYIDPMATWNSIPQKVTTPYGTAGTVKRHTHTR